MNRGDKILATIVSNAESEDDGSLANNLLREFYRGYPVEKLALLLSSNHENVLKRGVWIASELGQLASPLLGKIVGLLSHPTVYIRFFAIDSVLTCASERNENEVATVVSMVNDDSDVIRRKALDFLYRASEGQLRGALRHFERTEPSSQHIVGIRWLIDDRWRNSDEVLSLLRNANPIYRKYGVVAAARMASCNFEPLMFASSVEDPDIRRFAKDLIDLFRVRRGTRNRGHC